MERKRVKPLDKIRVIPFVRIHKHLFGLYKTKENGFAVLWNGLDVSEFNTYEEALIEANKLAKIATAKRYIEGLLKTYITDIAKTIMQFYGFTVEEAVETVRLALDSIAGAYD